METVIRIPRPIGSSQIDKDLIQEHITKAYINTNYMYCNKPMNLETFSQYTNIDIGYINNMIITMGQIQFDNLIKDDQQSFLRALLSGSLKNALSDRSTALQHQNILLAAQGPHYVPFVSAEVTKAIKLTMDSNTNILNIVSKITGPGSGITINNNVHQEQTHNTLNVVQALELIKSQANSPHSIPLLEDPNHKESLYMEYGIQDMPEVNATMQTGYDTSREGLTIGKITDLVLDSEFESGDLEHSEGHINRRAESLSVDLDSDNI